MSIFRLCAVAVLFAVLPLQGGYAEQFKEGETLRNQRKFAEAEAVFRKAAAQPGIQPDQQAVALLRIGQCYFWRGQYAAALAEMRKAEAVPNITRYYRCDIHLWLGDTLRAQKQYDAAVSMYEKAAVCAPVTLPVLRFNALMNAANGRKIQKKFPEAMAFLQQAAKLDRIPAAQRNRALLAIPECAMTAKNYPAVIQGAAELLAAPGLSAADRKKAQTMIGKACFAQQQFERARAELEKAEKMPDK